MIASYTVLALAFLTTLIIGQSLSPDQATLLLFTSTTLSTIALALIIRLAWTRKLYGNDRSGQISQ